jgi:hypothetical protein
MTDQRLEKTSIKQLFKINFLIILFFRSNHWAIALFDTKEKMNVFF